MTTRRLVAVTAVAAAAVLGPATAAAADLTSPVTSTTLAPSTGPVTAVPSVPALPVPEPTPTGLPSAGELPLLGDPAPQTGDSDQSASAGPGTTPKVNPDNLPWPPALPSLPVPLPGSGGSPPSAGGQPRNQPGGHEGRSLLGDDALPPEVQAELCAVLTTILGPLPPEVTGVPASVIGQLPLEITAVVPADVLRTVTLQCPSAETAATPVAAPPAAETAGQETKVRGTRSGRSPRTEATGLSSLPHTGLVAGLPLAGLALVGAGAAVRRFARRG